jgi:hypothetical protein
MELIRECQPESYAEWEAYYFEHAYTKAKQSTKVDEQLLTEIGERLFEKITGTVRPEWERAFESVTLEECVEYVRDVTLRRTFNGYYNEISVVHGNLSKRFPNVRFEESDADLDHAGDIDYLGWVGEQAFGLQIKPVTASYAFGGYSVSDRMRAQFDDFQDQYGGRVFIVYSVAKEVKNSEVYGSIQEEINRLSSE